MDPSLFEEFAREFMAEVNRQQSTASAAKAGIRSAPERIERQITSLIDAILEGADAKPINAKLKELEAEKERLESALNEASEDKLLLHPNLAAIYRAHVETIEAALRNPDHGREAFEIVRSLIEQVRIIPTDGEVTIELKGELVGILVLAEGAKRGSGSLLNRALQIKMVAGARYSFGSPRPQYGFLLSQPPFFPFWPRQCLSDPVLLNLTLTCVAFGFAIPVLLLFFVARVHHSWPRASLIGPLSR